MTAENANPKTRRVLIVKLGAIGDVLMAVPAAWMLNQRGFAVDWVCGESVSTLLACYPWITCLVADERAVLTGGSGARSRALLRLWQALAGRRYDLLATLYYDRRYRLLTWPVRAGRRVHLSERDRRLRLLPGRHHTDEYARILLGWPDERRPLPLAPVRPERLPATPLARGNRQRVVLVPAGARNLLADDALRRWPAELYVELAAQLLREGFEVVLSGGPGDTWVQPLFGDLAVTDLIGRCSLPETLALFDEADVLVTHDTGPLHLGGVTRVGIVALFGPTDPHGRLPQRPGTVAIWGGEGFACRPCYDGRTFAPCPANDCMRQITPAAVLAEIHHLLAERARGVEPAPRVVTPASTVAPVPLVAISSALEAQP